MRSLSWVALIARFGSRVLATKQLRRERFRSSMVLDGGLFDLASAAAFLCFAISGDGRVQEPNARGGGGWWN